MARDWTQEEFGLTDDDAVIALENKDAEIEKLEKENARLKKWCEEFNTLEVAKENTKLKELLKQSRIYVKIDTEDYDDRAVSKADKDEAKKLLAKIDEVLK